MTSTEAREITKSSGRSLSNILDEIKKTAMDGVDHIDVINLSYSCRQGLLELGYTISYYPNRITLYIRVSW